MRESHPYRRVSESENAACNLPVTSLKSHCSVVIHHLGGLVAFRGWKQASFQPSSRSSVPQFPATAWMSQASLTLFSVTFTLFFFSLQLCVSSNLQHFPATSKGIGEQAGEEVPRLLSDPLAESAVAFIALLLLHLALSSSWVGGHTPSTVWWQFIYSPLSLAYAWACQFP